MPGWAGSTRRHHLPHNWPAIRARILTRDGYQCTWTEHGDRCPNPATDVDHIVPGNDHRDQNLRSLCRYHHRWKSSSEGGRASAAARPSRYRPAEPHPGRVLAASLRQTPGGYPPPRGLRSAAS